MCVSTLRFQLQNTAILFGTVLLLDPVHFRKYEVCLLIGSILNFEARSGRIDFCSVQWDPKQATLCPGSGAITQRERDGS